MIEGWCPRCTVTHPPGTRSCLHCGGPVVPGRDLRGTEPERPVAVGVRARRSGPFGLPLPQAPAPSQRPGSGPASPRAPADEESAEAQMARPLRIGMAVLWVLVAIGTALAQQCQRG